MEEKLEKAIRRQLNIHSAENASNTPDFILAMYLLSCLDAFNTGVQQRETWYGRDAKPTAPPEDEKDFEEARQLAEETYRECLSDED